MSIVIQLPRDVNRFCRTCMNVTEDHKESFENYLVLEKQPTDLSKMLRSVTSLNVAAEDGLPETLCSVCIEHLTAAYTFINQSKDVDANLRNLLVLSQQSEEGTETLKQPDSSLLPTSSLNKLVKHEKNEYLCQICYDAFSSYYQLAMHTIEHNASKSLFERFLENQGSDSKFTLNCKTAVEFDAETISLVKERKAALKSNSTVVAKSQDSMEIDNPENTSTAIIDNSELPQSPPKKLNKSEAECKLCTKRFSNRKDLISHICKPHADEQKKSSSLNTCSLCDKIFDDASGLSLHFLKHALASASIANSGIEAEFFFCEVCGATFESEPCLFIHYNENHDGKPVWACSSCSLIFEKESDLLKHNTIHSNQEIKTKEERVACVLCNGTFFSRKAVLKHSIEHLMKKYSCKKCSLAFCTQHSYFEHSKAHAINQYTCPTCGKVLSSKSALKSHIVGVHSVDLRHTCSTCGKSFATPSRLRTHSLIHTKTKKYVCTYCGYSAHKVGDLQIHTRIHTSERPYKCTFAKCSASFKTSSHLCEHVRRHLQIRKFKCSICFASFSTSHTLKIHHLQHTGERPHSCLVCHQKFRRKYHVSVHMKQHQPKS